MSQFDNADPSFVLRELGDLESATKQAQRLISIKGVGLRFGSEHIAMRAGEERFIVFALSQLDSAEIVERVGTEKVVQITVASDAKCFAMGAEQARSALAKNHVLESQANNQRTSRTKAIAPFILGTPHHVETIHNPVQLGGNIAVEEKSGNPAQALRRGGTEFLADPITLGLGPADQAGESPNPLPPPRPVPKSLQDPIELGYTTPFVDRPEFTLPSADQHFTSPYVDAAPPTGIPLTLPSIDLTPPTLPFPHNPPEPEPWSLFPSWLEDLFDGPVRPTGQFGDPWGLDIEFGF